MRLAPECDRPACTPLVILSPPKTDDTSNSLSSYATSRKLYWLCLRLGATFKNLQLLLRIGGPLTVPGLSLGGTNTSHSNTCKIENTYAYSSLIGFPLLHLPHASAAGVMALRDEITRGLTLYPFRSEPSTGGPHSGNFSSPIIPHVNPSLLPGSTGANHKTL